MLSQNTPATSCRDAAARRNRLGNIGIPLHDELRSHAVKYTSDDKTHYAILHCRANYNIDEPKATKMLGSCRPLKRVSAEELAREFDMQYGTVNPFFQHEKVSHIFDLSLLDQLTAPHTMMTNAGNFNWAVEFSPSELVDAYVKNIPGSRIGSITSAESGDREKPTKLPVFGILTGNGPESGMSLWRTLNATIQSSSDKDSRIYGDLIYPKIFIESVPDMGLSMELEAREDKVWEVIRESITRFCESGVTHIAIACNTTPWFEQKIWGICDRYEVEFISMPTIACNYIEDNKLSDVCILGIPVVAEMGEYSAFRDLKALGVKSVASNMLNDIQELGYLVKQGADTSEDRKALNKFRHILRSGVESKNILIALTEISVLLERFPKLAGATKIGDINIIDLLRLYGEALAEIYIRALNRLY